MAVANKLSASSKIAICGIFGSMSVVVMLLSGMVPIASIALPAISGCILIPVVALISIKYAYMVYAVVSVISLFVVADREAMLIYILFFGYYPVLYATLSKIKNKVFSYAIKLVIFNVAAVADYVIITFIFAIPMEDMEMFGQYTLIVLLVLANIVFIVYDSALKGVISFYFFKMHSLARKLLLRK